MSDLAFHYTTHEFRQSEGNDQFFAKFKQTLLGYQCKRRPSHIRRVSEFDESTHCLLSAVVANVNPIPLLINASIGLVHQRTNCKI